MIYTLKFSAVIVIMILADIAWAYYFITIEERKSVKAGIWAMLIYVFGMFVTHHYIDDWTFGIAAVIGSFIGTVIAVEYKKRKEKKV